MEKRTKYFLFFLAIIFGLLMLNQMRFLIQSQVSPIDDTAAIPQPTLKKEEILLGNKTLAVEVARTTEELARGLSYRDQLGSDGMLFVLPRRERVGFWMKGMNFDLDILWIVDGKIDEISPGVPASSYEKNQQLFYPARAVDLVLELPSGMAVTLGIKVGDVVQWPTGQEK